MLFPKYYNNGIDYKLINYIDKFKNVLTEIVILYELNRNENDILKDIYILNFMDDFNSDIIEGKLKSLLIERNINIKFEYLQKVGLDLKNVLIEANELYLKFLIYNIIYLILENISNNNEIIIDLDEDADNIKFIFKYKNDNSKNINEIFNFEKFELSEKELELIIIKSICDKMNWVIEKKVNNYNTLIVKIYKPKFDILVLSKYQKEVEKFIEEASKNEMVVLIEGETGVGKEFVANKIHERSSRRKNQFVVVDCTSIPQTLIESELFGYVKGAFTGASIEGKKGKLEIADKGTLFLDEIGELPINLQAKLLRFIETSEIEKVGSTKKIKLDVRIIAATNRDLESEIEKGNFRKDLYYRLAQYKILLLPLRMRGTDEIKYLLNYYLLEFNKKYNKSVRRFSNDCIERLLNYEWPGNVRELKNRVERAVLICRGDIITLKDFEIPNFIEKTENVVNITSDNVIDIENKTLEDIEMEIVRKILQKNQMNITKTASELGISRMGLIKKIKRWGIS